MDVLVKSDPENAERVVQALNDIGFSSLGLVVEDFTKQEQVIQLGVAPVRIDILTSISGVLWEDAWNHSQTENYDGVEVKFLGREQFLVNKHPL